MRAVTVLAAVALLAVGVGAGWLVGREDEGTETVTTTLTQTETTTETTTESLLPQAVEATHSALLEAAEAGDYEALRPYIGDDFGYTFGGPVEGGPIAYWQELERTSGKRPLETLAAILEMPYTLSNGIYVWPWAYTVENAAALSGHERELLAPLGSPDELFAGGSGYLGWRAGIRPDGTWAFFVAGD